MNKLIGKALRLLTCFLCLAALTFLPTAGKIYAEEENQFRVQTTATNQTDTIRVTVYLNNAKDVGAIDVTLSYDPERVSFVESSLGESLNSVYSDIYHDESAYTIHYLILYMVNVDADGILLTADFELLSGTSYQPELIVNQLVDGNTYGNMEYTVSYLHSDGTWADTPDSGDEPADAQDAEDALNAYGSEEDVENGGVATGTVTLSSDNKVSGNSDTVEETTVTAGSSQIAGDNESQTAKTTSETEESTTKNDSSSNSGEATDATMVSGDSSASGNTYDDSKTGESGERTLDEGETGDESEELTTLDSSGGANTDGEEGNSGTGVSENLDGDEATEDRTNADGTADSENTSNGGVGYLVLVVMICAAIAGLAAYIVLRKRKKTQESSDESGSAKAGTSQEEKKSVAD